MKLPSLGAFWRLTAPRLLGGDKQCLAGGKLDYVLGSGAMEGARMGWKIPYLTHHLPGLRGC
jgi:hypothetical protein